MWLKVLMISVIVSTLGLTNETCHYQLYKWNTITRTASKMIYVSKDYNDLLEDEIDQQTGCSICEEDQLNISLPGLKPFRMCKYLAPQIKDALEKVLDQGIRIETIKAYRVGLTRGSVDALGFRTKFSNHSFGIAIDINEHHNGLYDNCISFSSDCVLIKGGVWSVEDPLSMHKDHRIVKSMKALGMRWGGQIYGWQKDYMHFSPTGY